MTRYLWMWCLCTTALAAPPEQDARLIAALSVRHDAPSCSVLEADLVEPAAAWARLATQEHGLPWISLRAARCLMGHPEEASRQLSEWLTRDHTAGLLDVAFSELDRLPKPSALTLARQALATPHAQLLSKRLVASSYPELRALVEVP